MKKEIGLIEMSVLGYKCFKCGYKWIPRNKNKRPQTCSRCKRRNWDKINGVRLKKITPDS